MTRLDTNVPDCLSGCQNCAYRIKSISEAADLLQNVIRQAHMRTIDGGGVVMEARLDYDTVIKLCVWEVGCPDCELSEDFGDGIERDSQGACG